MRDVSPVRHDVSRLTDHDVFLFKQGNHFDLPDKLGSHPMTVDGSPASISPSGPPNAAAVSVIGDHNGWEPGLQPLAVRQDGSGIFEGFLPNLEKGTRYKYHIASSVADYRVDKGDPYAFYWETSPQYRLHRLGPGPCLERRGLDGGEARQKRLFRAGFHL